MSENAAIPNPSPRSPLSIGVFWFASLVAATGLWTGVVSVDSLPELPWTVSSSVDPSTTGESRPLLPDPFRSSLSDAGGGVLDAIPTLHLDEQLGAPEPIPTGTVAGSGFSVEVPESESAFSTDVDAGKQLSLSVSAPESVAADKVVMVWVNVKNTTDAIAQNITLTCRFDDHFEFPGRGDGVVRQRMGSLDPGSSRGLALPLTARRAGQARLHLLVSSETHADTTAEHSLEVHSSQAAPANVSVSGPSAAVNVDVSGPQWRTVGSRAEYVVTIVNKTGSDLPDTVATVSYKSALQLRELSAGAVRQPGILRWDLGTLFAEERIQIQVEFECAAVVPAATLTAAVTSGDRPVGTAESRLSVAARPDLELRVSDTADPLESGQTSTCLVEVENHSARPAGGIVIHLVPSPNIEITGARVRHGNRELDLNAMVEGNGVSFQAAPPLEPGGRLRYEVDVNAVAAGPGELRALLQSRTPAVPLEVREPFVINPSARGS